MSALHHRVLQLLYDHAKIRIHGQKFHPTNTQTFSLLGILANSCTTEYCDKSEMQNKSYTD